MEYKSQQFTARIGDVDVTITVEFKQPITRPEDLPVITISATSPELAFRVDQAATTTRLKVT